MTVPTHEHMTPKQRALLGVRLKLCRQAAKLSQRQVGEKVGISRSAVANIERAATLPGLPLLVGLARLFGARMDWLLDLETKEGA